MTTKSLSLMMEVQMEHWKLQNNFKISMAVKKLYFVQGKRSLVLEQHMFMVSDMQLEISL